MAMESEQNWKSQSIRHERAWKANRNQSITTPTTNRPNEERNSERKIVKWKIYTKTEEE